MPKIKNKEPEKPKKICSVNLHPCMKCEYFELITWIEPFPCGGHPGYCSKHDERKLIDGKCDSFKIRKKAKKYA